MNEKILKDKDDLLQDQDSLIDEILNVVEKKDPNALVELIGHIACGISVIATQMKLQTLS